MALLSASQAATRLNRTERENVFTFDAIFLTKCGQFCCIRDRCEMGGSGFGRNDDAHRVARQAADLLPIEKDALAGPYFLAGLAQIEAHTGHFGEAAKILRRLLTIPAGDVVSIARLKIDPVWDSIRNDPGFQKLISEPEAETVYK